METFITAIQKIVIKDVVLYARAEAGAVKRFAGGNLNNYAII
jgi:hypothetical protein